MNPELDGAALLAPNAGVEVGAGDELRNAAPPNAAPGAGAGEMLRKPPNAAAWPVAGDELRNDPVPEFPNAVAGWVADTPNVGDGAVPGCPKAGETLNGVEPNPDVSIAESPAFTAGADGEEDDAPNVNDGAADEVAGADAVALVDDGAPNPKPELDVVVVVVEPNAVDELELDKPVPLLALCPNVNAGLELAGSGDDEDAKLNAGLLGADASAVTGDVDDVLGTPNENPFAGSMLLLALDGAENANAAGTAEPTEAGVDDLVSGEVPNDPNEPAVGFDSSVLLPKLTTGAAVAELAAIEVNEPPNDLAPVDAASFLSPAGGTPNENAGTVGDSFNAA